MQGISDDQRKLGWNGLHYASFKHIVSSISIRLDDDFVHVPSLKFVDTRLKIVDVVFGPLNL